MVNPSGNKSKKDTWGMCRTRRNVEIEIKRLLVKHTRDNTISKGELQIKELDRESQRQNSPF